MTDLRTAAQQALEALEDFGMKHYENTGEVLHRDVYEALKAALVEDAMQKFTDVNQELESALAEPVLQTCNCRWDGEMQMQQCTLHEAHVDAIKEWAQRAKFAEKKLAALAEQRLTDMEQKMERSIESLKTALAEPEGGGNLPPPLQEPTGKDSLQVPAEVAATITTTDIAWLATCRLTKLWQELGQMRWAGADEGWDRAIEAVRSRLNDECQAVLDWKAKADKSQATAIQLLRKMQGVKDD